MILANLLILLNITAAAIYAAPTALDPVNADLRTVGDVLSPDLAKFDYASLRGDMTPAQEQQLRDIMRSAGANTQERVNAFGRRPTTSAATDQAETSSPLRESLMRVNAAAPAVPTVSGADLEGIKDLGQFAAVAYCANENNLVSWTCGPLCNSDRVRNAKYTRLLSGESTLGFVAVRPTTAQIVVAFRGSVNIDNWIDNLSLIRTNYPYARLPGSDGASVHQGFVDAYRPVRTATLDAIRSALAAHPTYQVVFTGHSQGGAIATLAAVDAVGERVSNDLVPHIPPAFIGYKHSVVEKYVLDGRMFACSGQEDARCSRSRVPFLSALTHLEFFGQPNFFSKFAC
ncbi:Alpha/Beta hydrolase protein [Catenaria anguillulae PL171]|uniref:Alpha/Beta hydrolase protein n=1 Tax=Catenaria anguillulae PL171 TaxID=765915 RepID=A0A1Y2HSM6_9FUNG|nr:Alpha/Beta hydrolase protein [Catenaria anguillulae PL171]